MEAASGIEPLYRALQAQYRTEQLPGQRHNTEPLRSPWTRSGNRWLVASGRQRSLSVGGLAGPVDLGGELVVAQLKKQASIGPLEAFRTPLVRLDLS
jgi:hypothetical protein